MVDVVFAKDFTEEEGPIDPGNEFEPTETAYLAVIIKGRPKEGIVTGKAYWNQDFVGEANVDLADVNSGVLLSFGENTYALFNYTPINPSPISKNYWFEIFINGEKLGEYSFTVIPPADSIPSTLESIALSKDVDDALNPVEPTTVFNPMDPVFLVGHGDFGRSTWFQIKWFVNGQLKEDCFIELVVDQNYPDEGLYFVCPPPEDGWPSGQHEAVLIMNDEEVGRYGFSVE